MTRYARLVISALAALAVGALSGCATEVAGTAQPAPGAAARLADPERVQVRLVLEDVTDVDVPLPPARSKASNDVSVPGTAIRPSAPAGSVVVPDLDGHRFLLGPVELDGAQIATVRARPNPAQEGAWEVDVGMTSTGRTAFTELTRVNTGQRFAIVVNHVIVSAPRITTVLDEGQVRITGEFTQRDAVHLAASMNGS